jgi:hypothetical protein
LVNKPLVFESMKRNAAVGLPMNGQNKPTLAPRGADLARCFKLQYGLPSVELRRSG